MEKLSTLQNRSLTALRQLSKWYKSVNKNTFNEYFNELKNYNSGRVLIKLIGYNTNDCTVCSSIKISIMDTHYNCGHCIWQLLDKRKTDVHAKCIMHKTWRDLTSQNLDGLIRACHNRGKYLESLIKKLDNKINKQK